MHGSRTCSVRSRQPRESLRQANQGSVASGGCSQSRALVKDTDNGSGCMLFWFHTGRTPRQQGMCICCPALSSQTYRGCQTCTDVQCVTAIHGRRLVPSGGHHCAWLVRCAVEMKSFALRSCCPSRRRRIAQGQHSSATPAPADGRGAAAAAAAWAASCRNQ